jgi:hypothetical protein
LLHGAVRRSCTVGRSAKYELEGIWEEAVVTRWKYCLGFCLKRLRKATKIVVRIAGT